MACILVPLQKRASHFCCAIETDRTGAQSIELNIDVDRAWNVLSRARAKKRVLNASSLPSMVLSLGICSTRCTPRSRQNNFQHAFPLGCLPDPNGRTRFRLRVRSVSLRKSCVSHLALLFPFHGFWGPDPWLLVHGFLGPDPCLFSSWVLGSRSMAVFFSFHHLSTDRSLLELVLELVPLLLSFSLILFPLVVFVTFSLSVLNLLSCRSAHRVPMNRSTSHLAHGTTVIFFPAVLLPSCCFQHCSTCLCRLLSLLTTTSLCNHANSAQTCRSSST